MSPDPTAPAELSPVKRALLEIRELRARVAELEAARSEPIAIVGMSVRAPGGVTSPESFAAMLWAGTDAIGEIPSDRWPLAEWFDEAQDAPGKMYTRFGGFVGDVDRFDAEFFGIAPVEAASMDPQQRLVLELAWEGLEDAGIAPPSLAGARAGVYLGVANNDYGRALFAHPELIDPYFSPGNAYSVAAGRVAYVLGLRGPAVAIDTACSSSLVALHLACQGLRQGDCDLALAGGVNLVLTPEVNVNFSKAGMMSRDGRCRTFDAAAAGYVRGEGGGVLVLRRLRDAVDAGDRILAVVRGSAVNQDGRSNGLTAPNGPAQEAVVRAAMAAAGVSPADVGYVEAHGTGTALGDPIEVNALAAAMGDRRSGSAPLLVGSLKTNVGHLEAAAGVAGVIKTVLAVQRGEVPPHLHFAEPNPLIDWDAMPVTVPTVATPWPASGGRRVAGVSAFGFSGTNAHVILESAPDVPADPADAAVAERPEHVLALSARDAAALRALAERYRDRLRTWRDGEGASLGDLCATANAGRAHFAHRLSVAGGSAEALVAALDAWLAGAAHPRAVAGVAAESAPRVAFLFPGQGPQYPGMGRELYATAPAFRDAFDACAAALDPLLDRPLASVVLAADADPALLDQAAYAQPAMFAVEYALAALWRSWGVEPAAVMGHSFGEYAAACVAGVLSLADAARIVVARGRLTTGLPGDGLMAVVEASEEEALAAVAAAPGPASIAAANGPANTVVSGERVAVEAVVAHFAARGRRVKRLRVAHAFHSPLMDPVLDAFARELADVRFAAPAVTVISNLTGAPADLATLGRADYWRDHLRQPVRFAQSVRALAAQGVTHYVELSPQPVLLGMAAESVAGGTWLPSLREGQGAWAEMLQSLQTLYAAGVDVDWAGFERGRRRRRVALPTYPFQRRRHWVDAAWAPPPAPTWAGLTEAAAWQSRQGGLALSLDRYARGWDALERLTTAYIASALVQLGAFRRAGERQTVDAVAEAGGVLPGFRRLLARWLERLTAAGLLREAGGAYVADRPLAAPDPAPLLRDAEAVFGDGADRVFVEYVASCGSDLPAYLTGARSTLETLFPGGGFARAEALYEHAPLSAYFAAIGRGVLEAFVRGLGGRPVRALEIGAGTGATTHALLPVLPAGSVYHFTDLSDVFLNHAREKFARFPAVRYGRLDAERAGAEQGHAPGSVDVVVATNVLHATRDLRETLRHVRDLLAPGGVLLLCEVTRYLPWYDVTTGLIEGWQAFEDGLRADHPLLPADRWLALLDEAGFAAAAAFPEVGSPALVLGQHVIVAQVPGRAAARGAARVAPGDADAPPVADAAADVPAPETVLTRLADAPASERREVLVGVVRAELARSLRVAEPETLERRRRLTDFGIDSLMAVELRNRLAAALRLTAPLPATLVFDHPSIDALAAYLERDVLGYRDDAPPAAPVDADATARRASELEALSEEEVERLLLRRLQSL